MLVLTRKSGQKLIINDNIEVTILETRGDIVKVGINAPRSVSIYREEVYNEIKKSNQQSGVAVSTEDLEIAAGLLVNTPQKIDFLNIPRYQPTIKIETKKSK